MAVTRHEEIALHDLLVSEIKKFHSLTAAFVMDMESYKVTRQILTGEEEDPQEPWIPVEGDMLQGYPMIVREGGGEPHIELVERALRPAHFAGMTSIGVERSMKEPDFFEEATAESVDPGHEEATEGDTFDAPTTS